MIQPGIISLLMEMVRSGLRPSGNISGTMPPLSLIAFMLPMMCSACSESIQDTVLSERNWQAMTGEVSWWN